MVWRRPQQVVRVGLVKFGERRGRNSLVTSYEDVARVGRRLHEDATRMLREN